MNMSTTSRNAREQPHTPSLTVGIDARLLSLRLTGIGRYILEVCVALSRRHNISLRLYSPAPIPTCITERLGATSIEHDNISFAPLRLLWGEVRLPVLLRRDNVDVFWGPAHRIPAALPRNMARVVTIHDLVWKHQPDTMRWTTRFLDKWQMPYSVKQADHIVCVSQATLSSLTNEFDTNPSRCSVIYHGASNQNHTTQVGLIDALNIHGPFFLFVGTLEPRKNLKRLLEAYASLSESTRSQGTLVIAGGKGWGGVDTTDYIKEFSLKDSVQYVGYVDDEQLAALYTQAIFLAMPSLYEGFGLPLIEAMSHGIPVLTSDNSSMPEIASTAGVYVDPLDVNSIRDGLYTLLTDVDLRRALGSEAQSRANLFCWDTAATQLEGVFSRAASLRKLVQSGTT